MSHKWLCEGDSSSIHRLDENRVCREQVDETERWLRDMSKYVSFPLEEGDVSYFANLLDTLGLSLVRNNGKKSRSKKNVSVNRGSSSRRTSGQKRGARELRNLESGINYEGREKGLRGNDGF